MSCFIKVRRASSDFWWEVRTRRELRGTLAREGLRVCWNGAGAGWVEAGTLSIVDPPLVGSVLRPAGDGPGTLPIVLPAGRIQYQEKENLICNIVLR